MKPILLCLHGWGGSSESFTELRESLKGTDIEILTPDLPGFGKEPEPDRPWSVDDYAHWVVAWLSNNRQTTNDQRLFLLGHSHGGRIAIKLATRHPCPSGRRAPPAIRHLFLCAAAGIRRPRHFKRIVGLTLAKTGKFFLSIPGLSALQPLGKKLLYKFVRVHDYENASSLMRETLIKVTAEDLRPLLPQITIPTDIFWGADDRMTPVADAYLIHQLIPGSRLHIYPQTTHRVHRQRAKEIAEVIKTTLNT